MKRIPLWHKHASEDTLLDVFPRKRRRLHGLVSNHEPDEAVVIADLMESDHIR
jgi:hypothetical protein